MHPILSRRSQLFVYLLGWIPIAVLLVFLLAASGRMGWLETSILVVPLCAIYQFVCLSAWYSCRFAPIHRATLARLLVTHLAAALLISFVWTQIARIYVQFLSRVPAFAGLDHRFPEQQAIFFGAGVLIYLLSVAYHYILIAMDASRVAEARALETSVLARDAELRALKAQVNPHFLFNSLNSISALTSIDPSRAREMCILLAEFLRMTLGVGEKNVVPLREELDMVKRFVAIEQVRFGARLKMDGYVEEPAQACLVPPLILQPLVENAVVHGIANLPEGGTIRLSARCSEGQLHLLVENSFDPEVHSSRKGGLGLANVRQRLEARYPKQATMRADAEENRFRVTISIPAEQPQVTQPAAKTTETPEAREVRS